MKLKNASRYFDTCPVYDGYTGDFLFNIQASTFMEAAAEGSVSTRRTISLDPELVVPAHSVLTILGERYVTGEINSDEWSGSAIRKTCWTKKVTDLFQAFQTWQLLSNEVGTPVYGQKRQKSETTTFKSSNQENIWEGYFSANSPISKADILRISGKLYRVAYTYIDVDGFLTCGLNELQYDVKMANLDFNRVYNPITDSYSGSTLSYFCLPVDYKLVFDGQVESDFEAVPGDICLYLPVYAEPETGLTLEIADPDLTGKWRILNLYREADCWIAHVRKV